MTPPVGRSRASRPGTAGTQAARTRLSRRIFGCLAAILSNARAGPSGCRRPCSQLRKVCTLMPKAFENPCCERPTKRRSWTMSSPDSNLPAIKAPRVCHCGATFVSFWPRRFIESDAIAADEAQRVCAEIAEDQRQPARARELEDMRTATGPAAPRCYMPMPPRIPTALDSVSPFGCCAMMASVVSISAATEAALTSAVRTTFVGSMMPAFTRSS